MLVAFLTPGSRTRRFVCWPCPAGTVAVSMGWRLPASSMEGDAPRLVQTEASLSTLSAYGVNVEVAGDPRFDRVLNAVGQHQPDQALQTWVNDRPCLVVGSAGNPSGTLHASLAGRAVRYYRPHEWTAESIAAEASRWEAMGARPVVWSAHRSEDARAGTCQKAMC